MLRLNKVRFKYSTTDPSQDEFDSLPRLPLVLQLGSQSVEVVGLVDSGSTVNVLPYEVGLRLGQVGMSIKQTFDWQAHWAI